MTENYLVFPLNKYFNEINIVFINFFIMFTHFSANLSSYLFLYYRIDNVANRGKHSFPTEKYGSEDDNANKSSFNLLEFFFFFFLSGREYLSVRSQNERWS